MVFYSDGFLRNSDGPGPADPKVKRFLTICAALPLELQMTLCNRMFRSPRNIVSTKDSEPAFKWLARDITWQAE